MKTYQAVVLDRDGVINEDSDNYIRSPEQWLPYEDSLKAIAKLNRAKLPVGIITNQSGIGRGYFDLDTLAAMHDKMRHCLAKFDAKIDTLRFCPHTPEDNCSCRKPEPIMLQSVCEEFGVDVTECLYIGDRESDYLTAKNAGCDFALVLTGKGAKTESKLPTDIKSYPNLAAVIDTLMAS